MFRSLSVWPVLVVLMLGIFTTSVRPSPAFANEPSASSVRAARPPLRARSAPRLLSRRSFLALPKRSAVVARPPGRIASALAGFAKDGPAHTLGAIRRSPRLFAALVAGTATVGGGTHVLGIDPAPIAIGASAVALGVQIKRTIPRLRSLRGAARWRAVAADVGWPAFLAAATTIAGHSVPHPVAPAGHSVTAGSVAGASAQTVVIAGDAPAVAITALDTREHR